MTAAPPRLGVGMIGYAFMGIAHSQAWRNAPRFFDLPLRPDMTVVAGRSATRPSRRPRRSSGGRAPRPTGRRSSLATTSTWSTSARRATPTPRSRSPRSTPASTCCARSRWPTPSRRPRRWSARPRPARASRWSASPTAASPRSSWPARSWPTAASAPSGTCARSTCRTGSPTRRRRCRGGWTSRRPARARWATSARTSSTSRSSSRASRSRGCPPCSRRSCTSGPVAATSLGGLHGTRGHETGPVTVDDAAIFLGRMSGGGLATFEATRFAWGRKNAIRLEINGSAGSLAFDFEDMNVLHFFDASQTRRSRPGFRRIVVTEPEHAYVAAWWPPGHGLGYEHAFTHQAVDLVSAIAEHRQPVPSFADGLVVQRVLDAVERSAADRQHVDTRERRRADDDPTDHPVHRPVGRPAVRGGRAPGVRSGATTASRSPAGATTWTRGAGTTTSTSPASSRCSRSTA